MKNAKRLAALFLTAAVLLTAGCSRKTVTSQSSVWFIAKSTNTEFWKSAFAGANAAKSEYNVDLTICGPETEEDYEEQNRLIDEAVAAGADAIVYSAISYTKNAEAITRAAKQGLKIAVIDSDRGLRRRRCAHRHGQCRGRRMAGALPCRRTGTA